MRLIVLFALVLGGTLATSDDAFALGKRKKKAAACCPAPAPVAVAPSCCGGGGPAPVYGPGYGQPVYGQPVYAQPGVGVGAGVVVPGTGVPVLMPKK